MFDILMLSLSQSGDREISWKGNGLVLLDKQKKMEVDSQIVPGPENWFN